MKKFKDFRNKINELNGQTGPVLKISYKPQRAGGKLTSHSTITKSDLYKDVVYNNKNWKITANTNSIEIRLPHAKGDEKDRKDFLDLINSATGDVSNLIRGGRFTKSEVMELKKDYEKAAKAFGATKVVSQDHSIYVEHDVPGKLKVKEGLLAMLKALDEFGMKNHISLNGKNGVLTQIQDAGQYNESVSEGVYTRDDGGAHDGLRIAKYLAHQDGKSWRRLSYGETQGYLDDGMEMLKKDKSQARSILSKPTPRG